jgi:hypothetical protein
MRGSLIPSAKRIINSVAPLNPNDLSEANALNLMFLYDNIATGEYVEDSAVLLRHLANLRAREQVTPNLTLEVLSGVGWFSQNSYQVFAGGNSPTFTAPTTNPRIDILTLRNDGTLQRIAGTEAASPVPPSIPSTDLPLAQVYNVVGQTRIRDNDEQEVGEGFVQYDLRPMLQPPLGGSAMPKLGPRVRDTITTSIPSLGNFPLATVFTYTGSGRLRSVHNRLGFGTITNVQVQILIDGVLYADTGILTSGTSHFDLSPKAADATANFEWLAGSASSRVFLDLFFKSSVVIKHGLSSSSGAAEANTIVDMETE